MKTRIAASLLTIAMALSMMVGTSTAYFSDTGRVAANQFTTGRIDLKFSTGDAYRDNIKGVWSSPKGWAPGEECSSKLLFTNAGTVDARQIFFHFTARGDEKLLDAIVVTEVVEYFNGDATENLAPALAAATGNGDGLLTLGELVDQAWMTQDDRSGDGVVLDGGNRKDYRLAFAFKFPDAMDDTLLGLGASFDLKCVAAQNASSDGFHSFHR